MSMTPIEDVTETGTTLIMDGKHFLRCHLTKCTLIYSGGDFAWTESSFQNCEIRLEGPAQRTAAFMNAFHLDLKKMGPAPQKPMKSDGTVN